jgi:hypothetical protein
LFDRIIYERVASELKDHVVAVQPRSDLARKIKDIVLWRPVPGARLEQTSNHLFRAQK